MLWKRGDVHVFPPALVQHGVRLPQAVGWDAGVDVVRYVHADVVGEEIDPPWKDAVYSAAQLRLAGRVPPSPAWAQSH